MGAVCDRLEGTGRHRAGAGPARGATGKHPSRDEAIEAVTQKRPWTCGPIQCLAVGNDTLITGNDGRNYYLDRLRRAGCREGSPPGRPGRAASEDVSRCHRGSALRSTIIHARWPSTHGPRGDAWGSPLPSGTRHERMPGDNKGMRRLVRSGRHLDNRRPLPGRLRLRTGLREAVRVEPMPVDILVFIALCGALFLYLMYALLRPERF